VSRRARRYRHHGVDPRKVFFRLGVDRPHGAAAVPTHRHGVVPACLSEGQPRGRVPSGGCHRLMGIALQSAASPA
jgi:hypothetical protein